MFDSLPESEQESEERVDSEGREKSSGSAGHWAFMPAILIFALLYFTFKSYAWSWYAAVGGAYTVFVFSLALGSTLKDLDDLFGSTEVLRFIPRLLMLHAIPLGLLLAGLFAWLHLKSVLPEWLTYEGHKGSLWDLFGWFFLASVSVGEGFWLAGKVKQRFRVDE